jgi:hypothetical protein
LPDTLDRSAAELTPRAVATGAPRRGTRVGVLAAAGAAVLGAVALVWWVAAHRDIAADANPAPATAKKLPAPTENRALPERSARPALALPAPAPQARAPDDRVTKDAAPSAQAASTARVEFVCKPAPCHTIYCNGTRLDPAAAAELPPGETTCRVARAGYEPEFRKLELAAGQERRETFTLRKRTSK